MNLQEAIESYKNTVDIPGFTDEGREKFKQMVDWLTELEQLREEKRATGFESAYDRGYEIGVLEGQDEAWDAANWIGNHLDLLERLDIFGVQDAFVIFERNTATQAIAKIKAWEESKAIHVGDVVEYFNEDDNIHAIGAVITVNGQLYGVVTADGNTAIWYKSNTHKTGRSVDVEGFLKQIGGTDEAD